MKIKPLVLLAISSLLTACGTTWQDRAVTGGMMGAGAGLAAGALIGAPLAGAAVGMPLGGIAGGVTKPEYFYFGEPIWYDKGYYGGAKPPPAEANYVKYPNARLDDATRKVIGQRLSSTSAPSVGGNQKMAASMPVGGPAAPVRGQPPAAPMTQQGMLPRPAAMQVQLASNPVNSAVPPAAQPQAYPAAPAPAPMPYGYAAQQPPAAAYANLAPAAAPPNYYMTQGMMPSAPPAGYASYAMPAQQAAYPAPPPYPPAYAYAPPPMPAAAPAYPPAYYAYPPAYSASPVGMSYPYSSAPTQAPALPPVAMNHYAYGTAQNAMQPPAASRAPLHPAMANRRTPLPSAGRTTR